VEHSALRDLNILESPLAAHTAPSATQWEVRRLAVDEGIYLVDEDVRIFIDEFQESIVVLAKPRRDT
jgi:hypothetical protein